MVRRAILLGGLVLLLLPATALAGGWVVITVETLPEQIRAGQPLQIGFMVRQHGRTPTHAVEPMLTATNPETGEQIQVRAEAAPEVGRYMATITFPSAGAWQWSISAEPFPQTATFSPLTVLAAEQATKAQQIDLASVGSALAAEAGQSAPAGFDARPLLRLAGLVLLAGALLLFALQRWRGQAASSSSPAE